MELAALPRTGTHHCTSDECDYPHDTKIAGWADGPLLRTLYVAVAFSPLLLLGKNLFGPTMHDRLSITKIAEVCSIGTHIESPLKQ